MKDKCKRCKGTGACDVCGGTGVIPVYETDDDFECDECNASGKCPDCGGTGIVLNPNLKIH